MAKGNSRLPKTVGEIINEVVASFRRMPFRKLSNKTYEGVSLFQCSCLVLLNLSEQKSVELRNYFFTTTAWTRAVQYLPEAEGWFPKLDNTELTNESKITILCLFWLVMEREPKIKSEDSRREELAQKTNEYFAFVRESGTSLGRVLRVLFTTNVEEVFDKDQRDGMRRALQNLLNLVGLDR